MNKKSTWTEFWRIIRLQGSSRQWDHKYTWLEGKFAEVFWDYIILVLYPVLIDVEGRVHHLKKYNSRQPLGISFIKTHKVGRDHRESYHRKKQGERITAFSKACWHFSFTYRSFLPMESEDVIWGWNLILENSCSVLDYSGWKNYSKYIHITNFTTWFTSLISSCFFFFNIHAANSFCFTDKETDNQNSPTCQKNAQITEIFPVFFLKNYIYKICLKANNGRLSWKVSWYKTVSKGTNFKSVVF